MKFRILALWAVLVACGSVRALATWANAEWGMTQSQVLSAMNVAVDAVAKPDQPGTAMNWARETLTRGVTTEHIVSVPGDSRGLHLFVMFMFSDNMLEEIWEGEYREGNAPPSEEFCDRFEGYLRDRYGAPKATFTFPDGKIDLGWEEPKYNNAIVFKRTPGKGCPAVYSPITGAKVKHVWVGETIR